MSTLSARPAFGGGTERASVALPTVTCSSCSDSIPLSSLGEHVCRPPRSMGGRSAPRPSQITIPTPQSSSSSGSWRNPSPLDRAPPRPAFAGPSSVKSSPGANSLMIPDISSGYSSPVDRLSPHSGSSGGRSPSPRTPSPTNPFFPALPSDGKNVPLDYGLGLTVPMRPEGPFPTDAPLPAGASDLSSLATASTGEAGMAGVGRRAFQAAAWGVTAGISMASQVRSRQQTAPAHQHQQYQPASSQRPPIPHQPRSAGPTPSSMPPWQQHLPTPAQPVVPPSAPLSGRSRSDTNAHLPQQPLTIPAAVPQRSASAMDRPVEPFSAPPRSSSAMAKSPPRTHRAKPSISSSTSSRSSYDAAGADSIAQLLKARNPERKGSNDKANFFDKYKEMQRTNSKSSDGTSRLIPHAKNGSLGDREIMDSLQQTTLDLEDEDEGSALPWATPMLADSPEIKQGEFREKKHHRKYTAESESSSGSSRSGRYGASGPNSEEVVTPSQSLEGFQTTRKDAKGYDSRGPLNQIHESDEDENERVVFGGSASSHVHLATKLPRSQSNSTIVTKDTHSHSHSSSRTTSSRRTKTCQKCGQTVGGAKKFVERDGVVLCEADWKKMYLPSCRRCSKLIETKMVSADDGQLKGKWHAACFTCTRCDQPFENGDFYVHAGRPWCQYHYAQETGTLCAASTCRRPIEGACILTQGSNPQRFHPGHLRCDHDGCRDSMEEYYDVAGQRFCERHVRAASLSPGGQDGKDFKAEKRKTRLVDLPRGGLGF